MSDSIQTTSEIAALELRKAILRGDLKSGDRLIPAKLEKELGLSRMSIREAIRELVGVGLVASTSHKGAFIAEPLSIDEMKEIFEVRYQLEGKAAFLGAQKISETDIIQMELLTDKFRTIDPIDEAGFFMNQEFHMILYRATGWRYLIMTIERMFDQVMAFRSALFRQLSPESIIDSYNSSDGFLPKTYFKNYHRIIKHVKDRNPEEVKKIRVSHIKKNGFDYIYQLYKQVVIKETKEIVA